MRACTTLRSEDENPLMSGQSTHQRYDVSGTGQYSVVDAHHTSHHASVVSAYMAIDHSCCIPWDWPLL